MLLALRNGTKRRVSDLRYTHLDHLGSTSVVTNSSGAQYGYTRYYPYGSTRDSGGSLDTSKKFTGQRLDGTGLYYYGARYYDPTIGRFISADTVGPSPLNPQSYNRYSYCFNNPLAFIDPTGNWGLGNICKWVNDNVVTPIKETAVDVAKTAQSAYTLLADPSLENAKEFGTNLGNAALGRGTVDAIAGAIETGDWKTAALNITMAGVQVASNFVVPGGGKLTSGIIGKAGAEAVEKVATKGALEVYQVGTYGSLQNLSKVGDDLILHHVGQTQAMKQVVQGFTRTGSAAIALPTLEHRVIPKLSGTYLGSARSLLARDIWNLRRYTNAPNSSLWELIELNKQLFPGSFVK